MALAAVQIQPARNLAARAALAPALQMVLTATKQFTIITQQHALILVKSTQVMMTAALVRVQQLKPLATTVLNASQ